jgi:hypothetical protein
LNQHRQSQLPNIDNASLLARFQCRPEHDLTLGVGTRRRC